jgi:hypothetical protein
MTTPDRPAGTVLRTVVTALAIVAIGCGVAPGGSRDPVRSAEDATAVPPSPPSDAPKLANRLDEIGPLLSKCLQWPTDDVARAGMRVTLRLAFTRDGEILGEPRFTFTTPGVPVEIRIAYRRAVVDMLNRCTPLPITKELGAAIAGRPFVFGLVETRKEKKAERSHVRTL